jgi:biotin carboxylase
MATVAIIEPRSSGCWLIDKADELGHRAVVLTANTGGRRVPDVHLRHASSVEIVETNDDEAVIRVLHDLHDHDPIDAVLPGFEHYVPLAAQAAVSLGLPGLDPLAALRMRHKHLMRHALAAAGVDQPRYAVVATDRQLIDAVSEIGLPCVVKPVDQSGSINVRRVNRLDEAQVAFRKARNGLDPELGRDSLSLALVEELVAGPEYSVEGFVQDGRVHTLAVTKKLLASGSQFVEVGHIVPADLHASEGERVQRYVARVAHALGLTLGPFHAEVRLSARGPLLMEIAARLAGDRIPYLLSLSRGIDLYEIALRCHLGLQIPTPRASRDGSFAGVRYFLRSELSRYSHVSMAESLRRDPRIKEFTTLIRPGADVPPADSSRARLGYAVVTDRSYDDLVALLEEVDRCTAFR